MHPFFICFMAAVLAGMAIVFILKTFALPSPRLDRILHIVRISALSLAGLCGGFVTLASLFAGLWGGEIFPILASALALPSFFLLCLKSPRLLAGFLWFLTAASSIGFYLAVRIDSIYANNTAHSDFSYDLWALWNPFTRSMICVSGLVTLAVFSELRKTEMLNSLPEQS